MELCNYHTHTTYCDGKNTAEEMVLAALSLGFTRLGFSGHSHTDYEPDYPMSREDTPRYCAEIRRLREKYAGKIEIYLGMELDSYGDPPAEPLDYSIGSVHGVPRGGAFAHVDESRERQMRDVRELFGGDYYAFCRAYFGEVAQVKERTGCDIVGHFDLATKFNEDGGLFDAEDPRFLGPALEAAETLCREGAIFEINTGAMSKGYRTAPYPSETLLRAIRGWGAPIVLSSDSHSARTLDGFFPEAAALAKRCGFRTERILTKTGWEDVPL